MILIDYSQVVISAIFASDSKVINEFLVRHIILQSILGFKNKFGEKYGDIVICIDSRKNWRKEIFPEYKRNREKKRDDDDIPWDDIFRIMNEMALTLYKPFGYKVISEKGAEADDIIGSICAHSGEPCVICSSDGDFVQLLVYDGVVIWNPRTKKMVTHSDPKEYLIEHIIKGDTGDGVPNILSDDDVFVDENKRQKSIFKKKMPEYKLLLENGCKAADSKITRNIWRNKTMIDLTNTPWTICHNILNILYKVHPKKDKKAIRSYLAENKCVLLLPKWQQF